MLCLILVEIRAGGEAMKKTWINGSDLRERGQVVVEYVLLLVASVSFALLLTRVMVSRDPGNPGFVIKAWETIIKEIAADLP